MANFDTASKKTAEISPKDFVHLCFGFETIDITDIELIQPEQPTVDMRQADVVIKAEIGGKQVIVHFEFQTNDFEYYLGGNYGTPFYFRTLRGRSTAARY